jgi:hypothetical protein
MFSEHILKAIRGSLFIRKGTLPENSPEAHSTNQALALIDSMLRGDTIASLWTIEDVKSLRGECSVEQISADGEDDGLTWYHCTTHNMDTLSDYNCEKDGESTLSDETARKVLKIADDKHDAEQGINWDVLRAHLDDLEADATND